MSKDKIHTFEKIERIAVLTKYRKDFLVYCDENRNDKKVYFHVFNKDSCVGFVFDGFIDMGGLSEYVVNYVKAHVR